MEFTEHFLILSSQALTAYDIRFDSGLLFSGALFLLSFFTLLIFLKTKRRLYLYYFLFLLFTLVEAIFFIRDTIVFQGIVNLSNFRSSVGVEIFTLLAYSAYCLFTLKLFKIRKQSKPLYHWISIMALSGLLYAVYQVFFRPSTLEGRNLAFLISRTVIFAMSVTAILWVWIGTKKSPIKNLFIIGSWFYFLGALVSVVKDFIVDVPIIHLIPKEVYFHWGIFIEIIFFTIALSVQLYKYFEEKEQIQIQKNVLTTYERDKAEAEALALKTQINPHFLFNALNVLKYFIQIRENKKAIDYLVKFSQFVRKITAVGDATTIPLEQELHIIEKYLLLEKIRFDNKIDYRLQVDQEVGIKGVKMIPLLLQPFVEETIWGNFEDEEEEKRKINIKINQFRDTTYIVIEEEGNNKKMDSLTKRKRDIINNSLTRKRVDFYNNNNTSTISIDYINPDKLESKKSQFIIKVTAPRERE